MTEIGAAFLSEDRQLFPRDLGELLALYAKRKWPRDTAKMVERWWKLDATTAANLTKGHAGPRSIYKAMKAEKWPLFMALGEAISEETYQQHLHQMVQEATNVRDLRAAHRATVAELEARAAAVGLQPRDAAGEPRRRNHGRR